MKKLSVLLVAMVVGVVSLVGCSRTARDEKNVTEMEEGKVVEIEGPQDQYGWLPHMRLTFDGKTLTEVYFDYVDDSAAKKSQDEEYNSTMQEKTGMSAKDAMEKLRSNLLETQDPKKVDIVAGATQTSTEFIEMAKQAFNNYKEGKTSANNYGEEEKVKQTEEKAQQDKTGNEGQPPAGESGSPYTTGGDGNPNAQAGTGGGSQDMVPVDPSES